LLDEATAEVDAAVPRLPEEQIRRRHTEHVRKEGRHRFGDERLVAHICQRKIVAEAEA
jgi:hypothetical protein